MKFIRLMTMVIVVCLLPSVGIASSDRIDSFEFDASIIWAEVPGGMSNFYQPDNDWSVGAGFTADSVFPNFQLRIDAARHTWLGRIMLDNQPISYEYQRIPITLTGRYRGRIGDHVVVFAQGGPEISLDTEELPIGGQAGIQIVTNTETNAGIVIGVGMIVYLTPHVGILGEAKQHVILNSYGTLSAGLAFSF